MGNASGPHGRSSRGWRALCAKGRCLTPEDDRLRVCVLKEKKMVPEGGQQKGRHSGGRTGWDPDLGKVHPLRGIQRKG